MAFFGIALAALGAMTFCPVPPTASFTIGRLVWTILWYLPLPWMIAVAVMALSGRSKVNWPVAATALWFGPIAVLSRTAPEWIPIPVALWTLQLVAALVEESPPKHRALSVVTALSIQGVVLLAALEKTAWTAVAIMIPAAILAWGFAPITLRWARPVIALVILLFALIPMSNYLQQPPPGAGSSSTFAKTSEPPAGESKKGEATLREVHRGVILWPPKEEHLKIVAPLPAVTRQMLASRAAPTLRIPFSGVYWFFQPPYFQVPKESFTERGVPTEKSYRSTGGLPMLMEAHQHLGTTIEMTCCSAIQVEVTNADPFGHETLLELILWYTTQRGKPAATLGMFPVETRPTLGVATPAVLTFPLPTNLRIQKFDAVSIRFHRPQFRRTRSAKIAIQAFVLVPRMR